MRWRGRSEGSASSGGERLALGLALWALLASGCSSDGSDGSAAVQVRELDPASAAIAEALTFHASFDNGPEADFGSGERRIFTAPSYKDQYQGTPGIGSPDIEIAAGAGRFGDAPRFKKKNTKAQFYKAKDSVAYSDSDWAGTVSFWLSLDPSVDLEPGFCDPIQVTHAAYNDAALWVDFTKDNPRQFRLGVCGDLKVWNPDNLAPDDNPNFQKRLVVVNSPPFERGRWTHIVITHSGLNTESGVAKLYMDGELRGVTQGISEPFTWDLERAAIRLGVNYVGLYDEVSFFSRALTDTEIRTLHELEEGVSSLYPK